MMLFEMLINVSAFVGIVIIGLMTYHKNPKSHTNFFYFLFSLSIALYLIMNYEAINQPNDTQTLFWIQLVMGIAFIINQFFLLLALTFPKPKHEIKPWVFYGSILFTVVMVILNAMGYVFSEVVPGTTQPVPGPAVPLFMLHNVLYLGGGSLVLLRRYRRAKGIIRAQYRLFIAGALFMFLCIIVTNVILVIIFKTTQFVGLLPLYMMAFVSFIGYAIVRHRFLDIKMIVARSVTYSVLIFILGLFYAVMFSLIGSLFYYKQNPSANLMMSAGLALIMAYSFQPLRIRISKVTDKIFYKNKYDERVLLSKLSHIMASTLELDEIVHLIMRTIILDMKISKGYMFLMKKNNIVRSYGLSDTGTIKSEFETRKIEILLQQAQRKRGDNMLIFDEIAEDTVKKIMRDLNIALFFPLIVKKETVGAIMLSDKSSGDIYSTEDFHVFNILAPEIAISLKNSLQYEEIKNFSNTLKDEVKQATSKLASANRKLKELDKMKDDFVSVASHELRTPMTAIKSYLWMALEGKGGKLRDKQAFYLDRAYTSTNRLIKLVNDMLNISRIESGRITIEMEKVDIVKLTQEIIEEVKPRANELGLTVELTTQDKKGDDLSRIKEKLAKDRMSIRSLNDVPFVVADADKIKEVLLNLIGNSLKFTDKGGKISVYFTIEGEYVKVNVMDTGKGIDKKDMNTLFTKFGMIEGSYTTNKKASGTGLGLYISKSIINLHGGTITAYSDGIGEGSVFSFTLPIYHKGDEKVIKPPKKIEDEKLGIIHTGI